MTLFRTANRLRRLRLSATHDHFKIVRPEDEELRRVLHEAAAHLESKAKEIAAARETEFAAIDEAIARTEPPTSNETVTSARDDGVRSAADAGLRRVRVPAPTDGAAHLRLRPAASVPVVVFPMIV